MKNAIMWIIAIAVLLFGAWLCRGQMLPPVPKLPKKQLMSPKDAASRAPAIVIPPAPFTNRLTLAWNRGDSLTNAYGYVIQYRPGLSSPWVELGRTTNVTCWAIANTNARGFYRVGAFWP